MLPARDVAAYHVCGEAGGAEGPDAAALHAGAVGVEPSHQGGAGGRTLQPSHYYQPLTTPRTRV